MSRKGAASRRPSGGRGAVDGTRAVESARAETVPVPPPMRPGDWVLIAGLTLFHLLTFINKPPHVDDTLYLETAKGILADPLRPLCNSINWEMIPRPIYLFAVNPPLYNYQQALFIKLFGWNIPMLHVLAAAYVFLAAVAVFYLARRFTGAPRMALLLLMLSPTLLPQTNLMLDVPAMALVAASAAAWIKGVDERSNKWMAIAALAMTAATSTKYNSFVVLPLMLLYSTLRRRWASMLWIAVPLAGLGLWRVWNYFIFPNHAFHLTVAKERFDRAARFAYQQIMLALMSWGGAFFFLPAVAAWAWMRKRVTLAVAVALPAMLLFTAEAILTLGPWTDKNSGLYAAATSLATSLGFLRMLEPYPAWKMIHWPEQLFFVGNALLLSTFVLVGRFGAWRGLAERWRDGTIRDDLFLLAWVGGMTLFNCLFAPHHAPRYYFPAYPAVALLLMRSAACLAATGKREPGNANPPFVTGHWAPGTGHSPPAWLKRTLIASIALQTTVGLFLVLSDNTFARASQDSVARLAADPRVAGKRLDYVGHWGFQYHAQQHANFRVMDVLQPPPPVGGLVAVVMDTGWGEFPWWLKDGMQGRESFSTEMPLWRELRRRVLELHQPPDRVANAFGLPNLQVLNDIVSGRIQPARFRVLDSWDVPHPWLLRTVGLDQKLLLYSPRFYHNRLPYGFGAGRSHRVVLLERAS